MKYFYLFFLLLITSYQLNAQAVSPINDNISPNGIFDQVFDKDGRIYSLKDIIVDTTFDGSSKRNILLCTSGYFNVYFEQGSGMEGSTTIETSRRNVICQVLNDISTFLPAPTGTPLSAGTFKINIWVRNLGQIITNPQSSGVLGLASSFYVLPNGTTTNGGIVDNEIYKSIISGYNSFTNVSAPLGSTNNSNSSLSSTFFHGMMAFNFANPIINWELDLSTASTTKVDLYTVALHEITHALGFASLINFDGTSRFGSGFPYYSRFDLFLKNGSGNNLIIPSNSSCNLYNYTFNSAVSLTALTPSCTVNPPVNTSGGINNTVCNNSLNYNGGVNVPIYTPACYEAGSSLSHFEDQCYPSFTSPYGNDAYFVMSNAQSGGGIKRHLTPEERTVLCDLGYAVNSTYGSSAVTSSYYNYGGSQCSGKTVAGINDGINSNGYFSYVATAGGADIAITGITSNDLGNPSFECLQVILGGGSVSTTSGTNSFSFTPPATAGISLLRYVPVSGGQRGNITYIFVYNQNNMSCQPNTCNLVPNGDFEQYTGLPTTFSELNLTCGWADANAGSADYYHAGNQLGAPGMKVPCNIFGYQNDNNSGQGYVGLGSFTPGSVECIYAKLNSPLQPNTSYSFSIDASMPETFSYNSFPLQIYFADAYSPSAGNGAISISNTSNLYYLGDVSNYTNWTTYTLTITTDNNPNLNYIVIGNLTKRGFSNTGLTTAQYPGSGCNYLNPANQQTHAYVFLDNIKLQPHGGSSPTFTPPSPICINQNITLDNYVSIPGGTFAGPGVSCSGGVCSFSASTAGYGNHSITYTYVNNLGCTITVSSTINVTTPPVVSVTASNNNICSGDNVTLTANGANSYTWSPNSNCISPCNTAVIAPSATTIYTVTGNVNGCTSTSTVTVNVQNCTSCSNCAVLGKNGVISTSPSSAVYCINNNVTINGTVTFRSSEIKIAAGVKIKVTPGSSFNILGCHLYSCSQMWQGIEVEPGGRINVGNHTSSGTTISTLIEDAVSAIKILGNSTSTSGILTVANTTFNRNHTSIEISNYTRQNLAPFSITNSVFTCRDLPFTSNSMTWPQTNNVKANNNSVTSSLQTPYINNSTYSQTNAASALKAPMGGKSVRGIFLTRVGETINAQGTPTYYEMIIGTSGSSNFNLFDNHIYGIYAQESNFTCMNNIFQNAIPDKGNESGSGIYGVSTGIINCRMQVIPAGTNGSFTNRFYDCSNAIYSLNYFEKHVKYCDIRSTQVSMATPTSNHRGTNGIYTKSNRFRKIDISDNNLYNVENGIIFKGGFGQYNIGGVYVSSNGQYSGHIDVNRNSIKPSPTNSISTEYVSFGISVTTVIPTGQLDLIPSAKVNVNGNNISSAYIGMYCANWGKKDISTSNNIVTLKNDPYNNSASQSGISWANNFSSSRMGNFITGNVITGPDLNNTNLKGILISGSNQVIVTCNSTSNSYSGIEFSGQTLPCAFRMNDMSNHHFGFVLNNNGMIGPQGSSTSPSDNKWLGSSSTWSGHFKTATLNGSSSQNSKIFIRNTAAFNPNGSSISGTLPIANNLYSTGNGSLIIANSATFYIGCPAISSPGASNLPFNPNDPEFYEHSRDLMDRIVLDQIDHSQNPFEAKTISKNHLYRTLKEEPALMDNSIPLQSFYTESQNTTRQKFVSIEEEISAGNLNLAKSKTDAIVPQDGIEANYQDFYNTYLKAQTDIIDITDSSQLYNLAISCPFIHGTVVYQARELYNSLYNLNIYFGDNCDEVGSSGRLANSNAGKKDGILSKPELLEASFVTSIYPNPTSGEFTLNLPSEEINWQIIIKDVEGRIIYFKKITEKSSLLRINTDAENGIYLVYITNNQTNETVVKKLVIQK